MVDRRTGLPITDRPPREFRFKKHCAFIVVVVCMTRVADMERQYVTTEERVTVMTSDLASLNVDMTQLVRDITAASDFHRTC